MVRGELQRSLALQKEIADQALAHTTALASHLEGQAASNVLGLMMALQSEDRLRQRHEGLLEILGSLVQMTEARSEQAAGSCQDQAYWESKLLAGQTLEELKESVKTVLSSERSTP